MENLMPVSLDNLTRIEYQGQLVLTTAQLAQFYGCSAKQIQQNYNNNVERFIKGKHFFRLDGEELRVFKREFDTLEVAAPQLNLLYLWTKRGAARHAKMLNTDRAWEVFEALEDAYFNAQPVKKTVKRRRPCPVVAVVYVLLLSNNLVKIGYSANFQRRLHEIRKETGLDVLDYRTTAYMPLDEARLLESALKVKFFDSRTVGEFFCAEFNNVLAALNA